MHHAIQDPVLQREECAFLYGERVFKVREAGGATGGGGGYTLGDPEIFARPLLCQGFPGDISLCD